MYLPVMACAAQKANAPTVPVGFIPALWAKAEAPITKTLGTSQLCRYLFTALVLGSLPITAPPVLWVLWYGTASQPFLSRDTAENLALNGLVIFSSWSDR